MGQSIQPIIGGTPSGADHDAVIVLTTFASGLRRSLCTATLVAPNLLITARHCVSDTERATTCSMEGTALTGGAVLADREPDKLAVFLGKNGVAPNSEVESNASARGKKIVVEPAKTTCNRDVAFVVLDKNLDNPVAPLRMDPPTMTETLDVIGWGVDDTGVLPRSREIRTDVQLIGVGPALYPNHTAHGYGDAEFMLGESACAGDSGGPALSKSGAVVGIATRAGNGKARDPNNYASTCMGETAHAVYTHLASFNELVTRAFREAGHEPYLETKPTPNTSETESDEQAPPSEPAEDSLRSETLPTLPSDAEPHTTSSCSMTSEPTRGAVEYAAGLVALLASVAGLRRRLRRKDDLDDDLDEDGDVHRERLPSLP